MRAPATLAVLFVLGAGAVPSTSEAQFPRGVLRDSGKGCTIEVRGVAFGEYDTGDTRPHDGQGEVIYTCGEKTTAVKGPVKNIRIEISRGSAGSFDRAM